MENGGIPSPFAIAIGFWLGMGEAEAGKGGSGDPFGGKGGRKGGGPALF